MFEQRVEFPDHPAATAWCITVFGVMSPSSVTEILMHHDPMAVSVSKLGSEYTTHDPSTTDTDGSVRLVLQGDGRCSAMSMPSLCVSHQSMGL
jgi:hypothetical protein